MDPNPRPSRPAVRHRRWLLPLLLIPLVAFAVDDEEIPDLIEQLGDRNWKVREEAEAKLLSMGEKAAEALREALDHPDAEIRWRAEKLLRNLRWRVPDEVREKVGDLFDHYDDLAIDERHFVVQEVIRRLGAEGIDLLMRIAEGDEEPEVREAALRGVHGVGGKAVEERVLGALQKEDEFWAYRWAALLHDERGESKESLDACRKAMGENPHDPELNALFGRLLFREGLWEEATSALETMRETDQENPLYRLLLGKAYEEVGRGEDAAREYGEAVELEPETLEAYLTLIRTSIEIEKLDLALRFAENSEANYPGAPGIQGLRGRIHEARGEWDSAFRQYSLLYQATPAESSDHARWREKVREILGRRGEEDLATDDLLDEIYSRSIPVGLWQRLGGIYRVKGMPAFAVEELRRVLIFERSDPGPLWELAEVYHEMGDPERSGEAAGRALEMEGLPAKARERLEALRDGTAPPAAPRGVPPLLWEWKVREGEDWTGSPDRNDFPWRIPPVAAGSMIVSAVYGTDVIVGVDLSSGRKVWRMDPPSPSPPPEPRVAVIDLAWITHHEGAVYALYNVWHALPGKFSLTHRKAGLLGVAIDPATGETRRRFEVDASVEAEPSDTSPEGLIALPQEEGRAGGEIALLHLPEGRLLWTRRFRQLSDLRPCTGGGHVCIPLQGGVLVGLDAATGEEAWRHDLGSAFTTPPAAGDGEFFVSTSKGHLLRIDARGEETAWETELPEIASGMALLPGRRLLVSHRGGKISCWQADDGTLAWEGAPGRAAQRAFHGSEAILFALNGGTNSFWNEEAEVIAFRPDDGAIRWRFGCGFRGNLVLSGDHVVLACGSLRRTFRLAGLSSEAGDPGPDLVAGVLRMVARARAEAGEREVAAALLLRVLSLTERPEVYLDLARTWKEAREYDRAREALEKGEATEGADKAAFDALREEIEAEIEAREERRRKQEEETRKILEEHKKEQEEREREGEEHPEDGPPRDPTGVSGEFGR